MKTDIQLAKEHVCSKIEGAGYPAYPDTIPEGVTGPAFRVFYAGLTDPLEYHFVPRGSGNSGYDWSACRIQVEAVGVGADQTYTTLWTAAAAAHSALQNTTATPTGGTIFDCELYSPFEQADPDLSGDIKRVGGAYRVRAKAD